MKIFPVEAESSHADRHHDANSRFLQICERASKQDGKVYDRPLDMFTSYST